MSSRTGDCSIRTQAKGTAARFDLTTPAVREDDEALLRVASLLLLLACLCEPCVSVCLRASCREKVGAHTLARKPPPHSLFHVEHTAP